MPRKGAFLYWHGLTCCKLWGTAGIWVGRPECSGTMELDISLAGTPNKINHGFKRDVWELYIWFSDVLPNWKYIFLLGSNLIRESEGTNGTWALEKGRSASYLGKRSR